MQAWPVIEVCSFLPDKLRNSPKISGTYEKLILSSRQLTSNEIINSLAKHRVYQRDTTKGPDSFCRICYRQFCDGDYIKRFPVCKHKYHELCLDNWLKWVGAFCPEDKTKLISYEEEVETEEPEICDHENSNRQEMMESLTKSKNSLNRKTREREKKPNNDHSLSDGPASKAVDNVKTDVAREMRLSLRGAQQSLFEPRSKWQLKNQNSEELFDEKKRTFANIETPLKINESIKSRTYYPTLLSKSAGNNSSTAKLTTPFRSFNRPIKDDVEKTRQHKQSNDMEDITFKYDLISLETRRNFQKIIDTKNANSYNLLQTLNEVNTNPVLMFRRQLISNFPSAYNRAGPTLYKKPRKLEYE